MSQRDGIITNLDAIAADESEMEVLACCFADTVAAGDVIAELAVEDFRLRKHQLIFRVLRSLQEREEVVNVWSAHNEALRLGFPEADYGGYDYIIDLGGGVPTVAHRGYHIKRIKDASMRRQLVKIAHDIKDLAVSPTTDDPVSAAMTLMMAVQSGRGSKTRKHIGEFLRDHYSSVERAADAKKSGEANGVISTGFYDLDRSVIMAPGKVIIMAARPAMGKTACAFQIAKNVAKTKPVLKVTLEMTGEEIAVRVFAASTGKDAYHQYHGIMHDADWTKLSETITEYDALKLEIDEAPVMTVAEIIASARAYQMEIGEDLGLLVVDYIGLVDGDGENETIRLSKISRQFKLAAKTLGCPLLVLAQLSRAVENREDKRPVLSDLRQSGSIEQDADVVMFLYRDDYYNEDSKCKGVTELIIRKNRQGSVKTVYLNFDGPTTSFTNSTYKPPPGSEIKAGV